MKSTNPAFVKATRHFTNYSRFCLSDSVIVPLVHDLEDRSMQCMEWSLWGGPWGVRPNIEGMEGEWLGGGGYA